MVTCESLGSSCEETRMKGYRKTGRDHQVIVETGESEQTEKIAENRKFI